MVLRNKMAAEVSSLIEIRDKLSSHSNPIETLETLNTILENCPSNSEILQVATIVSPQLLFLYLSDTNDQVVKIACRVLSKFLHAFPFMELKKISQQLELGLQHTHESVRSLCLNLLVHKISVATVFHQIVLQPTMFHLVVRLLGDQSLECSQTAAKIIECLFHDLSSRSAILDSNIREGFSLDLKGQMSDGGDVVRFRVYDLLVRLAGIDEKVFVFVRESGFIAKLIGELESRDVLLKLNCLELLQTLIECPFGVGVVDSADVLKKLHSLLVTSDNDDLSTVLIPGIIKFFGHYCHLTPPTTDLTELCSQFPSFLQVILTAISKPEDDTLWGVATDTFALLASTTRGRGCLASYSTETEEALQVLGKFVVQSRTELRIRSLKSLSVIMSCDEGIFNPSESLSYKWCTKALPNFISVAMTIAKQPFPDLHSTGLEFLMSIAKTKWGVVEMGACPGFMEYLLDRSTESDKNGKELKYEIINVIVTSSYCEEVLGSPVLIKLRQYISEGPLYVMTEPASATLEED